MLELKGFGAWIVSDEEELDEYDVKVTGDVITCWVPSKKGKVYAASDLCVSITADAHTAEIRRVLAKRQQKQDRYKWSRFCRRYRCRQRDHARGAVRSGWPSNASA